MQEEDALPGAEDLSASFYNEESCSRRKWLEKITVPAIAAIGAGMIGSRVSAAPRWEETGKTGAGGVYNIRDFGAKGDGTTIDTVAVQAAIDKCAADNGGTVLVPTGTFIIGTIALKTNVNLHLTVQGKLQGSARREDYKSGEGVPAGNGNVVLLYAANADNISIDGRGTIDGNGTSFYTGQGDNTGPNSKGGGYFDRPHLIIFYNCTNILVRDTFFTKSAYHCFRILKCTRVNLDGVRIYNRVNKNNDGFHFNDSKYVHITNCDVACQDDACALFGSNQFVTVVNCTFSTRWSVFRFGGGDAQNITVSNCIIYETYGCPIKISSGKARIQNITFSNIIMQNVTGPISIGFSGSKTDSADAAPSFVRNLSFNNIRATVVKQPINHADIPFDVKPFDGEQYSCISLNGINNFFLENISFTDIQVIYVGGGSAELAAKRNIPQVVSEYFGVWKEAPVGPPAYGMYARNVKGLVMQNVRFTVEQQDYRPAVIFDNVHDASITGLVAQGNAHSELVNLAACTDIVFTATKVRSEAKNFVTIEGDTSDGIFIDGGDLRKATQVAVFKNGAKERALQSRI
ncbi:MAG: right-handed parallel beta-helix repeat-containing protein [Filimonas sp.]|nr:right-handed parallel beta-helix repeat-containing protein [Filimonas sp.]